MRPALSSCNMIPHRRLLEITRDTKNTLYIVAVFYVLTGFALAIWGLAAGDRLGTFVGFVIISGALATTATLRAVLRMGIQLSSIHQTLERLRADLSRPPSGSSEAARTSGPDAARANSVGEARIAQDRPRPGETVEPRARASADRPVAPTIDLATAPMENTDLLAAATLERGVFPRLVRAMEADPPAQSLEPVRSEDEIRDGGMSPDALEWFDGPLTETSVARDAAAVTNILRAWRVALGENDLPTCRHIFSALEDTAEPVVVDPLRQPLADLIAATEHRLRDAFSERRRASDHLGMLRIGRQICSLLPEQPIAADFRRIEPHLLRLVENAGRSVPAEHEPTRAAQ